MKKIVVKIGVDMIDDLDKLKTPKQIQESPDSIVYFKSTEQFCAILSSKKLGLMKYLSEVTGQTVTKVAIELHRKKEAVSRDLHQLESMGFVQMRRQGRNVYPKVNCDSIQIDLRTSA